MAEGAAVGLRAGLWDDNPATKDLLGFDVVVDAVVAALRVADLDPVTIGVHAPWGGGKSTVLELIEAASGKNWLVIRTNPWEYDDQIDPKGVLITEILTRLGSEVEKDEKLTDEIKKLIKRVSWSRLGVAMASGIMTMNWDPEKIVAALNPTDPQEGPQSLAQFRGEFEKLVAALPAIERVVVLVDDLDRCLPDAVMATLEAIKLFLSVKGMAFVVAADQDMVKNAIQANLEQSNRSQIFANNYLEKIVQLPVPLPRLSFDDAEAYIGLLLAHAEMGDEDFDALVSHCAARRREIRAPYLNDLGGLPARPNEETLTLASQLAEGLSADQLSGPRGIKRFLNAYGIRSEMAKSRGLEVRPATMVKLLFLEERFRSDFDALAATPPNDRSDLLRRWEDWARSAELEKPQGVSEASREWAASQPALAEEDINPYITLAASLAASRLSAGLSDELRVLVQQLLADGRTERDEAKDAVVKLDVDDQRSVAQALVLEARRRDVVDPAMESLVAIGIASPELADDIVADIRTQLAPKLTPGAGAELVQAGDPFRQLGAELADNESVGAPAREAMRSGLGR
jgi:hypothetical protein